jgi:hypothetical protein
VCNFFRCAKLYATEAFFLQTLRTDTGTFQLIMHLSVYLLNSPRLCACASYAEHQDDALEDSASNDPIAIGETVHVSHSSNDSNNCSATTSATANTAHKSSTSSQRHVDATGVAALCTVSCEDGYDDTCRDSREPSDAAAAAAAAAADATASIIVTSKHSPRRSVTIRYTIERYMHESCKM